MSSHAEVVVQEDWGAATFLMLRRSHEVPHFLHHFGMLIQLGYRFRLIRISLRLVLLGQGQFPIHVWEPRANGTRLSRNGGARLIFSIRPSRQPTLGFAYHLWLLCESSYLLFVWVVNAITFEHIASNPFCLLAEIPSFRCGVLSF